jgi:hypothetical protein
MAVSEPHDAPSGEARATETPADPDVVAATAHPDLAAIRAKGAEIDERLDRLEAETTPQPHDPATIGTMAGD